MSIYLFQILNGVGLGMIYFLLAIGLTIIFGLLNFVNFAHGAFFLLGAYLCAQVHAMTGNFWLSLLLAPLVVGILAWLVEKLLLYRTYHLPHMYQILVTLGLALIIQEGSIIYWGPVGINVSTPELLQGAVLLGSFAYPWYRLFVIVFAMVVALLLWILLEKTKFGALIRAGSENTEMVSLLGVNIFKLFSVTFGLGAVLAGMAGALVAPLRGAEPFMGTEALGIGFVVVVIGGMGSFVGALLGGILIGLVQSLASSLWPQGANIMIYGAMALVILLRPYGLFGRA
jgi:branched-chain amino acid transport system permease protein